MSYNKRIFLGITSICLALMVSTSINAKTIQVVSITQDLASITKRIGGDHVTVHSLIKGSRNLHNVTPKPSMVLALTKADLIIRLGMQQDSWIDGLIDTARNPSLFPGKKGYLDASVGITKLEVPHGKIDGRMGDVHIQGNPHYTLNPENGILIAKAIRDKLILLDPDNKDSYEKNCEAFAQELRSRIKIWKQAFSEMPETTFLSYHKVWPYFFDCFNLNTMGEIEVLPGIPPTTGHLIKLKKKAKLVTTRKLVISTDYYSEHLGQKVSKLISAEYIRVPVNLGEKDINSYVGLFDYIVSEITGKTIQ